MLRKISWNHTGGGGCETRGVKNESGGQRNDGSQNVSGMTFQIPRRNKMLDAPGGIIVLEDLQLGTNRKDSIVKREVSRMSPVDRGMMDPRMFQGHSQMLMQEVKESYGHRARFLLHSRPSRQHHAAHTSHFEDLKSLLNENQLEPYWWWWL
jgi:hypothetical protein